MPEEIKSISDARQSFPTLSETASKRLNRYIITNQGQPQSVLLGYNDYQSLKAATQILQQREVLNDIDIGLQQIEKGQGVPLDDVAKHLFGSAKSKESPLLKDAVAADAVLDQNTAPSLTTKKAARQVKAARPITIRDTSGKALPYVGVRGKFGKSSEYVVVKEDGQFLRAKVLRKGRSSWTVKPDVKELNK